jgi:hypothetical protein
LERRERFLPESIGFGLGEEAAAAQVSTQTKTESCAIKGCGSTPTYFD